MTDMTRIRRARRMLGLIALVASCTASPLPYPPSIDTKRMELYLSSPSTLTVVGNAGAAPGRLRMRIRNASRPTLPVELRAEEDGSFRADVRGLLIDTLRIDALNESWQTIVHIENTGGTAASPMPAPPDEDGDGYELSAECDDSEPDIFPAAVELCDGVDNDCDGVIDEPPACSCNAAEQCDDGLFCNGVETCINGSCVAGAPPQCDDSIPETEDRCDPSYDACVGREPPPYPYCGNGSLEPGEECDDGNDVSGDGCEPDCTEVCEASDEECNGTDDDCDGLIDEDFDLFSDPQNCGGCGQICDDTDPTTTDACVNSVCISALSECGNGITEPDEECDDGNYIPGDGCEPDCTLTG